MAKSKNQSITNNKTKNDESKLNNESKNIQILSEEDELLKLMGFNSFTTTKNKNHTSTDISGVYKGSKVKSKIRQYINRKGAFNKFLGTYN